MLIDVAGDGNCFYWDTCLVLHGNESGHAELRQLVADHIEQSGKILGGLTNISPDDGESFNRHILELRKIGSAVGQDAVMALSEVCQCEVQVYLAYAEPEVYRTVNVSALLCEPIRLGFFEPGDYRAVFKDLNA